MPDTLADLGRFSQPALLILISLAAGPKHGYAMLGDIERMAGARLGPGTLYGALLRMEQRGLIEALPVVERRQPFRMTGRGLMALEAQIVNLRVLAGHAAQRLNQTTPA